VLQQLLEPCCRCSWQQVLHLLMMQVLRRA
jgi:hypothetical protein